MSALSNSLVGSNLDRLNQGTWLTDAAAIELADALDVLGSTYAAQQVRARKADCIDSASKACRSYLQTRASGALFYTAIGAPPNRQDGAVRTITRIMDAARPGWAV